MPMPESKMFGDPTCILPHPFVRLSAKEVLWREAADEVEAAREMMGSIANTLKGQGADGVPPPVDKSWETYGPLGALQKCTAVCARYGKAWRCVQGTVCGSKGQRHGVREGTHVD